MGFYPRNPNIDTDLQTNVAGTEYDQDFIVHITLTGPNAAAEDGTGLGDVESSSSAETDVDVSGITQPDVARNVVINPSDAGTVGDIASSTITVTGTAIDGSTISEDFSMSADQAHDTTTDGSKAFATITAITIPAQDGADAEFLFGYGDVLGLPYARKTLVCLDAFLNESLEGTAPTVSFDASNIESNTIELNSALDGNQVDIYLVV